jgi:hypothetical protein
MPATFLQKLRSTTPVTVLSTELNSLANNAAALSVTLTQESEGDFYGEFELVVTFGTAPSSNSTVEMYFVKTVDGTNFEDASTTGPVTPQAPDYIFTVRNVTTTQRRVSPKLLLPSRDFKILLVNKTGQPFQASGNTLKMLKVSEQAV